MARRFLHTTSALRSIAPPYTISITNRSGAKKNYAVFCEAPTIAPTSSERKVATAIITSVRGVSPGSGQASFILSKQLYVTCGTYDVEFDTYSEENKKAIGTGTEVVDQRLIKALGSDDNTPGDLWEVDSTEGSPSFTTPAPQTGGTKGCFEVKTRGGFTAQETKQGKYVVGFSSSLRSTIGPYATFVPTPNTTYQIKPSKSFYLVEGDFAPRDLAKPEVLKALPSTFKVNFDEIATDTVQLVHDDRGRMLIQTA